METIFKTWKKATYFRGMFELREDLKFATPIDFPTVFIAYGKGIKNGNWQSYTRINTPNYVIVHYFDSIGYDIHDEMYQLWYYCYVLSKLTWNNINNDKDAVLKLIDQANTELKKLHVL